MHYISNISLRLTSYSQTFRIFAYTFWYCIHVKGARNFNPIPYYAQYFGHKLHLDQNEKLAMFGVTHVLAIDGYSSKIVGWSTMPVKNNLVIYDEVYRLVS